MSGKPKSSAVSANSRTNYRTVGFKKMFDELPSDIQVLAQAMYGLFRKDPNHNSLKHHELRNTKRGQHKNGSFAVHISYRWCAIYFVDAGRNANIWYWIGSHESYNNFTGA